MCAEMIIHGCDVPVPEISRVLTPASTSSLGLYSSVSGR
jgi:hypothetical protein